MAIEQSWIIISLVIFIFLILIASIIYFLIAVFTTDLFVCMCTGPTGCTAGVSNINVSADKNVQTRLTLKEKEKENLKLLKRVQTYYKSKNEFKATEPQHKGIEKTKNQNALVQILYMNGKPIKENVQILNPDDKTLTIESTKIENKDNRDNTNTKIEKRLETDRLNYLMKNSEDRSSQLLKNNDSQCFDVVTDTLSLPDWNSLLLNENNGTTSHTNNKIFFKINFCNLLTTEQKIELEYTYYGSQLEKEVNIEFYSFPENIKQQKKIWSLNNRILHGQGKIQMEISVNQVYKNIFEPFFAKSKLKIMIVQIKPLLLLASTIIKIKK